MELTPQFCGVFGCALMFAHRTLPRWMPDTTGLGHEGCWGTAWAPPWVGGADADGADADRTMAAGHKETVPGFSPTTTQGQRHREQGHACPKVLHHKPSPVGIAIPRSPFGDTPGTTTPPLSPAPPAVFAAPAGSPCPEGHGGHPNHNQCTSGALTGARASPAWLLPP